MIVLELDAIGETITQEMIGDTITMTPKELSVNAGHVVLKTKNVEHSSGHINTVAGGR